MSRLRGQLADPLLSVVMPAYNERHTIEEMIRRVLAVPIRTELIVVDDGSTDGSSEVLDRFAADERVRVIRQDRNYGPAAARNVGLDAARGEFVQFTDADDLLAPDALRLLSVAARTDDVEVVRGGITGFHSRAPSGGGAAAGISAAFAGGGVRTTSTSSSRENSTAGRMVIS